LGDVDRLQRNYYTLKAVQERQAAAFARIREEQEKEIAFLRVSTEELGSRLHETIRQYDDQVERYARRVGLLSLRDQVLTQLRALTAKCRRGAPDGQGEVLPRRAAAERPSLRMSRAERRRVREMLSESGLFSPDWYRRTYPDCARLDARAAFDHFLEAGLAEDRDPHPLFSAYWARRHCPDLETEATPPLVSFLEGRTLHPHPLFDGDFYLRTYGDIRANGGNPLLHYLRFGAAERRRPHLAFDPEWYEPRRGGERRPDLLLDYISDPEAFSVDPHPLFDGEHYLAQAPGLKERGVNPLLHFMVRGCGEALSPHPLFETAFYLAGNQDVAAAGINPFLHFLQEGARERRQAHPLFDTWWYLEGNPDVAAAGHNPLVHYVAQGAAEGRSPGPAFPMKAFREAFPDFDPATENPVTAFLAGDGLRLEVPRRRLDEMTERRARPVGDDGSYWLPDLLREYVEQRHGEESVEPLHELMRIVSEFGDRPAAFEAWPELPKLLARLQALAGEERVGAIDVSIIVPVHNAVVYTITSVISMLQSQTRYSYEILIADDASTDLTAPVFAQVEGRVRHLRQEDNLGFLANCNDAAAEATGRYLVFLNNDTILLPGWLDELIGTFEQDATIGLAGSKLLNADGTLQEAGGIMWKDGSAWNYGRGQNPWLPQFNYVKDVDYCSGASIAIGKELWDELGGFDPLFRPAYCEDSDLAFRVRAAGYRTVFQPFSELVHHEGRSHGRDEASGIKAYQVRNQQKFYARWAETLDRDNFPLGQNIALARDRSRAKPHILVVDHYVPQWDRDAGSRTMLHFIKVFLASGFHVVFWADNLNRDPIYTKPLQELGVEVIYGPEFVDQFESWYALNVDIISHVLLSRPHVAIKYVDTVARQGVARLIYYGHDLHWRRLLDQHAVTPNPDTLREAERVRADELRLAKLSDVVLYPSEAERDVVRSLVGDDTMVAAVPAWVFDEDDLEAAARRINLSDRPDRFRLLFVGGFNHSPNVDGLLWFMGEVWPLLAQDDRFHLTIVGSNPPPQIKALAEGRVAVTGQISDEALQENYAAASVAIVPLRFGGGVKGKVIEAFAHGVPVVSTSVGLQGIPHPGEKSLVVDDAPGFSAAIMLAARDRSAAAERAKRALAFVRTSYSVEALASILVQAAGDGGSPRRNGPPAACRWASLHPPRIDQKAQRTGRPSLDGVVAMALSRAAPASFGRR
jgi:GT2 family glycosyltransferase